MHVCGAEGRRVQEILEMKIPRVGYKTTASSSQKGDATSPILILVIACLVLAILILCSPETAQLTPEQINLLPLWEP
jgi:hypothetical protein